MMATKEAMATDGDGSESAAAGTAEATLETAPAVHVQKMPITATTSAAAVGITLAATGRRRWANTTGAASAAIRCRRGAGAPTTPYSAQASPAAIANPAADNQPSDRAARGSPGTSAARPRIKMPPVTSNRPQASPAKMTAEGSSGLPALRGLRRLGVFAKLCFHRRALAILKRSLAGRGQHTAQKDKYARSTQPGAGAVSDS